MVKVMRLYVEEVIIPSDLWHQHIQLWTLNNLRYQNHSHSIQRYNINSFNLRTEKFTWAKHNPPIFDSHTERAPPSATKFQISSRTIFRLLKGAHSSMNPSKKLITETSSRKVDKGERTIWSDFGNLQRICLWKENTNHNLISLSRGTGGGY